MKNNQALLSDGGIVFLCIYVLSLILIGWFGKKARKRNTLSDFYLAGRGMGVLVLFLTLYATQYSGITLVGFAGRAYREDRRPPPAICSIQQTNTGLAPGIREYTTLFIGVRDSQWYIHLGVCEHSICANACKRECREANGY